MHLSVDVAMGSRGDCSLMRIRGELCLVLGHLEPYAGYEFLNIGGVELQGSYGGFRVCF